MSKNTATRKRQEFLGMRWVDRDCLIPALFALVLLGVEPKAGAADIGINSNGVTANAAAIGYYNNNSAWTAVNGLTNTMIWTNTTTGWTNNFASGVNAPYMNGIRWDSSESVAGLTISGAAINAGILVGVNPTINISSSTGLIKLGSGTFAGSNGLTKTGLGQLNFQSTINTFTGGLRIDAGRVNFNNSGNVPSTNDLFLRGGTLNFGAALNLTFANVIWGDGTLTGTAGSSLTAASYTLTNSIDITNGYVLAGAGGLNKSSGAGNFTLNAANTFGGAGVTNIVSAGTLTLGNASALGSPSNSFELRGGTLALGTYTPTFATFTFAGGNLSGTTNTLTANTGFVVTGGTLTISNPLAGSGGFTQNGSGTTTLKNVAYTGTTTVSQGSLVTTGTNWTATVSPSTISMAFTGTVAPGNYPIYPGSFTGNQTLSTPTGLSAGQTATWNKANSTVQVQDPAGVPSVNAGQIFYLPLNSATSGAVVGTLTGQSTGTWAIVSGNGGGTFRIDSATGTLTLAQTISTSSSYTLGVTTSTSATVSVLVNVVPSAQAGVQYFDGNGVWSTTAGTDWTTTAGASSGGTAWVNSNNAVFCTNSTVTGGSGTNLVSSITVNDDVTANVAAGATIQGVSSNSGVITMNIGTSANYVTAQANDWSVGYIKNGAGSLVMSNTTSTYSGGFTLNAGSVRAANYNGLGAGNVTVNGGTLAASGTSNVNLSFSNLIIQGDFTLGDSSYGTLTLQSVSSVASIVGARTISLAGTNNSTWVFNAPISGAGASLTLIGVNPALTNTVQFNSANSFDGGLNIKDTKVIAGANGSLGSGVITFKSNSTATTQLALSGRTNTVAGLNSESTNDTAVSFTSYSNGELGLNSAAGTTNSFYGGISGTGTFTLRKSGEGTQWLNKANNGIAGGVILEAGNLGYGADKAFGTNAMTINGGRILTKMGATSFANAITANGDFGVDMYGSFFIFATNSSINLAGSNRVITRYGSPDGDLKIMGTISNGGLSLQSSPSTNAASGTSQFWLTGTNTYAGGTVVGTNTALKFSAVSSLGTQPSSPMGNFVVLSTASGLNTDTATNTFNFDANSGFQLGAASDPAAFIAGANWTSAYAPKISVSTNTTMTIQGVISDISSQAGALQKDGVGKLILTGANSYTGNTFVASGTLEGNASSIRGNILIGTTDTNNLGYTNTTALILNQASDATFGGSIAGKGTLQKSGAGVLTLTGALTYTNTTTVTGGSLVVTNATRVASITTNTVAVSGLTSTTAGSYDLLPGPLANLSSYGTPIVAGLAPTQSASLTNSPNLKLVIVGTAGSTFTGLGYSAGSENDLGANGLKNLMNYALGGTGPLSTPAAPVFSISGTSLTLTGNIRNDDSSLNFQEIVGGKVVGQWAYDLNGPWTNVDLTDTGASSTVANTTVKSFTQTIESGQPRKFMRFQVSK
jgi:autotransporter-associated beta strand protein